MPRTGTKWTEAHRANYFAALRQKAEGKIFKISTPPSPELPASKSAEYIVYHGSVYKRINKIKVLR